MIEKKELKKILVYLYHQFSKDEKDVQMINETIIAEMLEKKIDSSRNTVNQYLKENNVKLSSYLVLFESKFSKKVKWDDKSPIIIYPKGWHPIKSSVC